MCFNMILNIGFDMFLMDFNMNGIVLHTISNLACNMTMSLGVHMITNVRVMFEKDGTFKKFGEMLIFRENVTNLGKHEYREKKKAGHSKNADRI